MAAIVCADLGTRKKAFSLNALTPRPGAVKTARNAPSPPAELQSKTKGLQPCSM
jgi:hypothetical protein